MIDKVYIVIQTNNIGEKMIMSVWSTMELAQAAKYFHSHYNELPISSYLVVVEEINKAELR